MMYSKRGNQLRHRREFPLVQVSCDLCFAHGTVEINS